ncbi:LexA family protein [Fuchsiella alkaliacetigena]|uniref:LexA family protein n=1 Tax=Fuchsiella alkaliacetigena TaxID=957042 RepID=UPI00200AA94C|nr:S24 family peptidase [Fuchsiella alkaliacetigena]MCK8823990.1 helix-turn-helix domain-containing protein [Fuchsiella alkaliacetigena]
MEENIGEYLKKLRKEAGLTLTELQEQTGVSTSHLSKIERNQRKLKPKTMEKVAEPLNVSYELLMQKAGYIDLTNLKGMLNEQSEVTGSLTVNKQKEFEIIPVLKLILKNSPIFDQQNTVGYKKVSYEKVKDGQFFFLKIQDNSMMNNRIQKDDLVLVRKQSEFEDGDMLIVIPTKSNKAIVRRVYSINNNNLILQTDNPEYKPLVLKQNEVEIIGKAIEVRFDL